MGKKVVGAAGMEASIVKYGHRDPVYRRVLGQRFNENNDALAGDAALQPIEVQLPSAPIRFNLPWLP